MFSVVLLPRVRMLWTHNTLPPVHTVHGSDRTAKYRVTRSHCPDKAQAGKCSGLETALQAMLPEDPHRRSMPFQAAPVPVHTLPSYRQEWHLTGNPLT